MRAAARRTVGLFATVVVSCAILAPHDGLAAKPDDRIARVEQWLKAAFEHSPGSEDAALAALLAWSTNDLDTLRTDAAALAQLMRDPSLSYFEMRPVGRSRPRRVNYTTIEVQRLSILACAAAGTLLTRPCARLKAAAQIDASLASLADAAAAARRAGDAQYVLRRAALLHTDAAISRDAVEPLAQGAPTSYGVTVQILDGRHTNIGEGAIQWLLARQLLDEIKPAPDDMVRQWYRAAAAWMQVTGRHDLDHLTRARVLFPNDANLVFLSGCLHESNARPSVQTAVRNVSLPFRTLLDVGSERQELAEAERFFRRALSVAPDHQEARLRLARVLLLRSRAAEAAQELQRATPFDDPLLGYFAALLLGAAREAVGDPEGARQSYRHAAEMYPHAQSPRFALSALARRHGERSAALDALAGLFIAQEENKEDEDPWWTYDQLAGRDADDLLDAIRRPFLETPR